MRDGRYCASVRDHRDRPFLLEQALWQGHREAVVGPRAKELGVTEPVELHRCVLMDQVEPLGPSADLLEDRVSPRQDVDPADEARANQYLAVGTHGELRSLERGEGGLGDS